MKIIGKYIGNINDVKEDYWVRGHYRHLKSGKKVWVHKYEKESKKEKEARLKQYKVDKITFGEYRKLLAGKFNEEKFTEAVENIKQSKTLNLEEKEILTTGFERVLDLRLKKLWKDLKHTVMWEEEGIEWNDIKTNFTMLGYKVETINSTLNNMIKNGDIVKKWGKFHDYRVDDYLDARELPIIGEHPLIYKGKIRVHKDVRTSKNDTFHDPEIVTIMLQFNKFNENTKDNIKYISLVKTSDDIPFRRWSSDPVSGTHSDDKIAIVMNQVLNRKWCKEVVIHEVAHSIHNHLDMFDRQKIAMMYDNQKFKLTELYAGKNQKEFFAELYTAAYMLKHGMEQGLSQKVIGAWNLVDKGVRDFFTHILDTYDFEVIFQ